MSSLQWNKRRAWCLAGIALLVIVNVVVAVRHLGTRPGQTYRWVCLESGAEFTYNPSVFGSARFTVGSVPGSGRRWVLVEPRPPSPWLPWNWLARLLDRPDMDLPPAELVATHDPARR